MSISDLTYEVPIGKSDHCTLLFKFHCYAEVRQPSESLNYIKGDYESMKNDLQNSNWITKMNLVPDTETVEE